ncbi:DUF4097 domain-containing protein [Cytobacillus spongiae]|uniref:DUF4097 domain-containing protein n=1 Tax=Cytobacillus spongiae TaxID=2901381 RepID=UPI0032C4854F
MMQEERKRILKMVEEKKLTIDEALILLEQLEESSQAMEKKQEEMINELSTVVDYDYGKNEQTSSSKTAQSTKEKILEFFDVAVKKIKDFDLDLNFGQSVDISHIFQHGEAYLTHVDVDIANGSLQLIPWDQQDVRVECDAKVYRVESAEEARQSFLKDVHFAIEGGKLRFSTQQKWMKIHTKIYVPQEHFDKVNVRMFNGPIESENIIANEYKAKTANGKISVNGLKAESVEVETANGPINILNSRVRDLEAETINGAISLDGEFHQLDLQSFNGSIHGIIKNEDCGRVEAKATTGGIRLHLHEQVALAGEIKTNLGSLSLEFDHIQMLEEKQEVIQKSMKFTSLKPGEPRLKLNADTKSGAIIVRKIK